MTDPKPCPFCGSRKVHETKDIQTGEICIHCKECDLEVKAGWFEYSRDDLLRKYNRRATE